MRVLLVSNYIPDKQESMQRFASMLSTGLSDQGYPVQVWTPPVWFGGLSPLQKINKWLAYLDKYLLAWFTLRRAAKSAEIVHITDHSNAMYHSWLGEKKLLITCHDLLAVRSAKGEFTQQKTGFTGRLLQRWIFASLRRCPNIVSVSKTTEDDLYRLAPETLGRSQVVWNGLNAPFQRLSRAFVDQNLSELFAKRNQARPAHYIFHIGGVQWYKNRKGVISIFAEIVKQKKLRDYKLVIAGKSPLPCHLDEIERNGIQNDIQWLQGVSGPELESLYNGAACLLFPSLAEGFGWPIVEALSCGCPVVTSDRTPMTEIAGADTLYINPETYGPTAEKLTDWMTNSERQSESEVSKRCLHGQKFSAETMINAYIKVYKELV